MIKIYQKLREAEEKNLNRWGTISYKGKVFIEIFEENLNSDKYVQILSSKIEEMKMINNSNSILLQVDNWRVHWFLDFLRFYYDNDIKVLDWPPYSPNLNPIENIWANMKNKQGDKKYTKGQLISKIHEIGITLVMIQ